MLWCSAHEYTQSNAKWAVTVDPNNEKLQQRKQQIDSLRSKVGLGSTSWHNQAGCAVQLQLAHTCHCTVPAARMVRTLCSGDGDCVRPSTNVCRPAAIQCAYWDGAAGRFRQGLQQQ